MKTDMRVVVTKRMLREGLLRCMEKNPISKITVSDLCRESGINRATFYNHYDTPVMILKEIIYDYARQISLIYETNLNEKENSDDAALRACLEYVAERKEEIKAVLSDSAEHYPAGFCMEIIEEKLEERKPAEKSDLDNYEEYLMCAATTAAAIYGFILIWITKDIDKTPKELVRILKKVVRDNVFI